MDMLPVFLQSFLYAVLPFRYLYHPAKKRPMSDNKTDFTEIDNLLFSKRINKPAIERIANKCITNEATTRHLFLLTRSEDVTIAWHSLWVCNVMADKNPQSVKPYRKEWEQQLLGCKNSGIKRMLLNILIEIYDNDHLSVEILNLCFRDITSATLPPAVTVGAMKLAFLMSQPYPELMNELNLLMNELKEHPLTPAIKCTLRKIRKRI